MEDTRDNLEKLRVAAMAKNDSRGARLVDELEALLKLLRFQREALNNECFEGMGYKQMAADKSTILKSKELSLAYTRLVEAQIKLNKSLKDIAEQMTPEDERGAVRKYIQAMEPADRGKFIHELWEYHQAHRGYNPGRQMAEPVENEVEKDVQD